MTKIKDKTTMKVIVCTKYGPPEVIKIKEVEKPIPKNNEVLIKIHTSTVTPTDIMIRSGKFSVPFLLKLPARIYLGVRKPRKILGYELAGEIEAVGKDVKLFKKGDRVFGASMWKMSCNADYLCLQEKSALVSKPDNVTYEEAVAITDGGCTALHFLRQGNIQSGQKVLINGASGSIGTIAVQLAKYFGAEVTGVCSTENIEMVKSLGATKVIDYKEEDFTQNGETYDIIFDTVAKASVSRSIKLLKEKGIFLSTHMGLKTWVRGKWISLTSSKKIKTPLSMSTAEKLIFLKGLMEKGVIKPVIDRRYPLEQITEAHRYVETGHKKGNVVLTIVE